MKNYYGPSVQYWKIQHVGFKGVNQGKILKTEHNKAKMVSSLVLIIKWELDNLSFSHKTPANIIQSGILKTLKYSIRILRPQVKQLILNQNDFSTGKMKTKLLLELYSTLIETLVDYSSHLNDIVISQYWWKEAF